MALKPSQKTVGKVDKITSPHYSNAQASRERLIGLPEDYTTELLQPKFLIVWLGFHNDSDPNKQTGLMKRQLEMGKK
jgi:hypothetical protein